MRGGLIFLFSGLVRAGSDLGSRQLIIGHGLDLSSTIGYLSGDNVIGGVYHVRAFENEPVEITLQSGLRSLMDTRGLDQKWGQPSGFLNETGSLWIRPRRGGESVVLYVTDFQHQSEGNVTVVFDTVPSYDPRLYDLRSSVGYLEPTFSKDHYSYFLRVPEGSVYGKLRLTAIDDQLTDCVVKDEAMMSLPGSKVTGAGVTGAIELLSSQNRLQGNVLSVECMHPRNPDNPVRYMIQTVEQKGGSTRLRSLEVTGGDLDQQFTPTDRGVYTVDLMRDHGDGNRPKTGWVSFRPIPENRRANVTVEGIPVDPTTHNSPYFRIPMGQMRLFHIGVKTDKNPVEEIYTVAVSRPTSRSAGIGARLMDMFAMGVTAVSSTRAYHLLHNFHVLQWISAVSHTRGLDEKWYQNSALFHKFNWGGDYHRSLVKFDGASDRQAAYYTDDKRNLVPYISQDTPYGHPVDRWALKFLPSALVGVGNSQTPQWYETLLDREVLDLEVRRLQAEESTSQPWRSRWVDSGEFADDEGFGECLRGEDDCVPTIPPAGRRQLLEMPAIEVEQLMDSLEANYRESELVLSECRRLLIISGSLIAIGVSYLVAVRIFKQTHRISDLRKMYPRWLKPTRFWIFVLDLCYIGITQSTFSILFSPLSNGEVVVLDSVRMKVRTVGYAGLALWLVFGVGFIALIANLLARKEATPEKPEGLLFANIFSRWHDGEIKMIKALYKPLASLPLIGRLFDVEVCHVAPIVVGLDGPTVESKGSYTYTPIYLNEEPRTRAPWLTGHTVEAFRQYNASTKLGDKDQGSAEDETAALRDRHAMKYYNKTDETAVFLDLTDYHEGQYFNLNAKAMHEFPEASLGRFKKCVVNNYGQVVELQPEIQLKHLPCIGDSFEQSLMSQCITDRENLDLPINDEFSNVIAKCQKGNLHWWVLERVGVVSSIILSAHLSATKQLRAPVVFSVVSAILLAVAIPSAMATSLSDFWYKMETDYYLSLKTFKYDRATLNKFRVFPWRGEKQGHQRYLQICNENEKLAERYRIYSAYNLLQDFVDHIIDNDIWRSRAFLLIRAVAEHQSMTELLKASLCMVLMTTHTSSKVSLALCICFFALLLVNTEAIIMFLQQLAAGARELYFQSRTLFLATVDCLMSSVEFRDRLAFYLNRLSEALHANAVSFIYDGHQSETSHHLAVADILVVNNQMGTVMPGVLEATKSNWRKILDEENPLTRPCYTLQKTVHIANGIGVYRRELYRSLPVEIPMIQLCSESKIVGADNEAKGRGIGKLVATIQIVNHNYIRYIPGIAHTHDDDSFLSFYTDPRLVPTAGVIKSQYLGAGMVAGYDAALRIFRIRGPGIERGKTYNIKIVDKRPELPAPGDGEEALISECYSSEHIKDGQGECLIVCSNPGSLNCPVPVGYTPDLSRPIQVERGLDRFIIDPALTEVCWDAHNRILILYHERFVVRPPPGQNEVPGDSPSADTDDEFRVTWFVRPKPSAGRQNFESVVAERYGELIVPLPEEFDGPLYLSRSMFIRVRATDKSACLDIYGDDTNAYEFPLTASCRLPRGGPGDGLIHSEAVVKCELDSWASAAQNTLWATTAEDRIPCTVIMCVDPITEDYRVEPDFNAARLKVTTRITVLKALRNQIASKGELWRVWPQIMSQSDYAAFWRSCLGYRCFEKGKRFVDPLQNQNHPQLVHLRVQIQEHHVPALMELMVSRINKQIGALSTRIAQLINWRNAYDYTYLDGGNQYGDESLYDLYNQWQRSRSEVVFGQVLAQGDAGSSETDALWERFRAKRDLYQKTIPGFCYPMIVNKQFISKRANWEAQFNQWSRQLHRWLVDEEVAAADETGTVFRESYYPTLAQFSTSLRQNVFRPEDLRKGKTASVLHYVTNSLAVRGLNYYWRPDPLGSMFAAVRIWKYRGGESEGLRSLGDAYWMSCHVKLTGNALKIYRADGLYDPPGVDYDWNRASGWRIPLDCFEKIELGMARSGSPDDSSNVHLKTLIGLLTFRKNMNGRVDDTYVESIQDHGLVDNRVSLRQGDFLLQNGFDVPRTALSASDNQLPPANEINEPAASNPQEANVWPLQIRLFPRDLNRWESVVRACRMNYRRNDELSRDYIDPAKRRQVSESLETPPPMTPPWKDEAIQTQTPLPMPPIDYSPTESYAVDSEKSEVLPPPPEPIVVDVDPDWAAPFKGEYENWRYKNAGEIKHREEVVYRGGWKDGQRFGENCECNFRDPRGNAWAYKGGFYQDEFAGPGELVLKQPGVGAPKAYCVERFKGTFNLPPAKEAARSNSLPQNEAPAINQATLKGLLGQQTPAIKFIDDTASSTATLVVLDDREALSLGGDDMALALQLGKVADEFHKNKAKLGSTSSVSSGEDTLGDGQQGSRRYIPHQLEWTRKLDPTLGYQGLTSRFGVGLVKYSDGCTFDKQDKTGLFRGMPNGGGVFRCPICPLEYTGYMYRGRPDGRGRIIFRNEPGTLNNAWLPSLAQEYKGEWKNGKRNGYGVLTALNGCIVARGEWTDDMLNGEHCSIEIGGALLDHPSIRLKSYYGGCKMGKPEGRGDMTFKRIKPLEAKTDVREFVVYRGFFKNGVRDGPQGVMLNERGVEIYRGGFENDSAHGRVVRYRLPKEGMYTGDEVYAGNIVKGELSGLGVLYNTTTRQIIYDGMWLQNVPGGAGVRVLENGDRYEGQFVSGKPQGNGSLIFADGRKYEGPWFKAQPHGVGRYEEGGLSRIIEFQNGKHMQKKGGLCAGEATEDNSIPPFPNLDLGGHNYQYWNATCKVNANWIPTLLQETLGCWSYHEQHASSKPTELQNYAARAPAVKLQSTPRAAPRSQRDAKADPEIRITVLEGTIFTTKKNTPLVVCVLWEPRNASTEVQRTDNNLTATWSEVKRFTQSTARQNIGLVVFEGDATGRPIAFGIYNIMGFMIQHANELECEESASVRLDAVDGSDAGQLNIRIALKPRDPNDVPPRHEDIRIPYDKFPDTFRTAVGKLADAVHRLESGA